MATHVKLREVRDEDLPTFHLQQLDLTACAMAGFPPREYDDFMAHWKKIRGVVTNYTRAILMDEQVVGNIGSWETDGEREVGYWIGKEFWGLGIATAALTEFLSQLPMRPLFGYAAKSNLGSLRVLEKCGFRVSREANMELHAGGSKIDTCIFILE